MTFECPLRNDKRGYRISGKPINLIVASQNMGKAL